MVVERHSLLAMLLVVLISMPLVATVAGQDDGGVQLTEPSENEAENEVPDSEDVQLPIGVELTARIHEIIEAHKAEIKAMIEEFKFNNSRNHEERLEIIEAYHRQAEARLEEVKAGKKDLLALFHNGTIDHDEFMTRMRLLKASLKGCEVMTDKLGWQLSEVAKRVAQEHRHKAQMLKELNQRIQEEMKASHQEMKEEMNARGPPWMMTETTTETTTSTAEGTTTETTSASGSNTGGGKGRGRK